MYRYPPHHSFTPSPDLGVKYGDQPGACREAHTSLHYDPYHNLLCMVHGAKTVALISPAATRGLRTRPLWGESSNHAAADLDLRGGTEAGKSLSDATAVLTAELQAGTGVTWRKCSFVQHFGFGASIKESPAAMQTATWTSQLLQEGPGVTWRAWPFPGACMFAACMLFGDCSAAQHSPWHYQKANRTCVQTAHVARPH